MLFHLIICKTTCYSTFDAQGAFLTDEGINYRAVLETLVDIANGMQQLHEMDIVHSDLKV